MFNDEMRALIEKFTKDYIEPAFSNIRANCGSESISKQEVFYFIGNLIEEVKML